MEGPGGRGLSGASACPRKALVKGTFGVRITLSYGQGDVIQVELDDHRVAGIIHPNRVTVTDERQVLERALSQPLGGGSCDRFLKDARDVLFIVNDATRPTPTARVLEALVPRLAGHQIHFLVATGSHRAPTDAECRRIFGELYERYRSHITMHDARRSEDMVYVGRSPRGTETFINRIAMDAQKTIVIGSVEPHYFAGYTGGRKAFLPGVAGYQTIEQNHRFALMAEAGTMALKGNPVHEDMIDALEPLAQKEIFAIMTILDGEHRICACTAGDLHQSFAAAVERAEEVFAVRIRDRVDVVVSVANFPMDVDLYQSQKALENGKLALREGGILILVSKCRTGVGPETFARLLTDASTPHDALSRIERGYKLGYHKAAKIAEIAMRAQIWAATDLKDSLLEALFIRPIHDLQGAVHEALQEKGSQAKVLFLMDGGLTVPLLPADEHAGGRGD